ncbi:MAG: hypothetical protein M3Q55_17600 [Acidobacteriota bacterium]|nr:hypothetical protein [Acidobacteriota bacterium]
MKRALLPLILVTAVSCGSGGGPPTSPPVLTVEAYGGSVTPSTAGCNSGFHNFVAQEGTISVRLDGTNSADQQMSIQICPGSDIANLCTLPQQRITAGQTLSAPRNGGANQTLKLLRIDCVTGVAQVNAPITYATTLTYMK